jgi:hypothetical protein
MANVLGITEMTSAQSSKYATFNTTIKYITSIMTGARDISTAVPSSHVENACYICNSTAGAWAGFAVNDLIFSFGGAYYGLTPTEGIRLWVWDEDKTYLFNGSTWSTVV